MTPTQFLETLMALSARFRFRVTSSYRCKEFNEQVGGATMSQHQFWLAADVVLWDTAERADFCLQAKRLGLSFLIEDDHIHLQSSKPPEVV